MNAFRKEVDIMHNLSHPNVVLFMGACSVPGRMAIVTEYLPKGDLSKLIHDRKLNLPLRKLMSMLRDAALGMTWLHQGNPAIVHRDLKPSNLLVDDTMRVKVCDFGLSEVKPRGETLRDKDKIPGTPLWMAPEVLMGREITEKADVYAFGLILWEAVTRREPFDHHTDYKVFKRAICEQRERPPIPDDTLPALRDLISACWHHDPTQRPSFEQIGRELDRVIIDCTIADDFGRELWRKYWRKRDFVQWKEFFPLLCLHLEAPIEEMSLDGRALKALLSTKSTDFARSGEQEVSMERFGFILSFFGPLRPPHGCAHSFMQRVTDAVTQDWFHGDISKETVEQRLADQPSGTFLFRLSTSEAGWFTISKRLGEKVEHQRIKYSPSQGFSLNVVHPATQTVQTVSTDALLSKVYELIRDARGLSIPCRGSPYRSLISAPLESGYVDPV